MTHKRPPPPSVPPPYQYECKWYDADSIAMYCVALLVLVFALAGALHLTGVVSLDTCGGQHERNR